MIADEYNMQINMGENKSNFVVFENKYRRKKRCEKLKVRL